MRIHLVDGTWELFRHYFGAPKASGPDGREVGAVRGLTRSLMALLAEPDVTHVGVAFDHVIESFRNDLFAGYKTGDGIDPDLYGQFHLAEDAARALGVAVWAMVDFEADDALATAAARFADDAAVEQIVICTPDKDLGQCVRGERVVQLDRLQRKVYDEAGVVARLGVAPASVPDYLALVGDTADGIPGVPKWGPKSAATLLERWGTVDAIPADPAGWDVKVRGAAGLAETLAEHRGVVGLYKTLATLRTDAPVPETLDQLAWRGAHREAFEALARDRLGDARIAGRVTRWRDR
ncbi:MAG: flap endonuclease [Myxococcales bacterium]|nr:flap endonuclease [Myxococcales bacterium]MCB9736710.1 flap endonuclease [Deltaproteobacteria bacterium]